MTAEAAAAQPSQLEIGRVAKLTAAFYGRHWAWLSALGAPLVLVPDLANDWLIPSTPIAAAIKSAGFAGGFLRNVIAAGVAAIPSAIFISLVAHKVAAEISGEHDGGARNGLRALPQVLLTKLLCDVGVTIGRALLVIPGLILSLAWSVAGPVAALEHAGPIESLRRSADLTRDRRGAIFLLALIYTLIQGIASLGLAEVIIAAITGSAFSVKAPTAIARAVLDAVNLPISLAWYAGVPILYHELLGVRRGAGLRSLVAVFD